MLTASLTTPAKDLIRMPEVGSTRYSTATLVIHTFSAELNIPYYPLLRRNVDCIIALDASADSQAGSSNLDVSANMVTHFGQDLWFTRAEGNTAAIYHTCCLMLTSGAELAIKRGLRTWPKGTGWPTEVKVKDGTGAADRTSPGGRDSGPKYTADGPAEAAVRKLADAQEAEIAGQTSRTEATEARDIPHCEFNWKMLYTGRPDADIAESAASDEQPLSSRGCEVWIGSSQADADSSSRLDDLDEDALLQRDGIGVVYIPLAPNDTKVPNFDPAALSTWRTEVSEPESQAMMDVAQVCTLG